MLRIPKVLAVRLFLILIFLASCALAGTPISFRKLSPGDTLHVTFITSGCKSIFGYAFDFKRDTAFTAEVSRIILNKGVVQPSKTPETVRLGTVTLTPDDILGLDRLLTFYRSNPGGGCTTVNYVDLKQMRGDAVIAAEKFTDATCSIDSHKNLTTLPSIAFRTAATHE